jgi:hypothetical protein
MRTETALAAKALAAGGAVKDTATLFIQPFATLSGADGAALTGEVPRCSVSPPTRPPATTPSTTPGTMSAYNRRPAEMSPAGGAVDVLAPPAG